MDGDGARLGAGTGGPQDAFGILCDNRRYCFSVLI